jgi:hypothetical protein
VFETQGVDLAKVRVKTMSELKRSVRTRGKVLGHRAGVSGKLTLIFGPFVCHFESLTMTMKGQPKQHQVAAL